LARARPSFLAKTIGGPKLLLGSQWGWNRDACNIVKMHSFSSS
jgi:hypothetical protein